jgi:hypothetical protein
MKPSAVTCVGIIMIARMNVKIILFPLNSYPWIAYAVIVEKYVHSNAVDAAIKRLLNIPRTIGSVPAIRFFIFVMKYVPGASVNPFARLLFDLVAFMNST